MLIDDAIIDRTYRKHGRQTPELLRLYYLCKASFSDRSGVFSLEELADVLASRGYKTLKANQGGNRHRKIKDLEKQLESAPELFFRSQKGLFRARSKRSITKVKPRLRAVDASILDKDNKRKWTDLLIGIPSDGKTIDYKTISKVTGYTPARVCQAAKGNNQRGLIVKVNNQIIIADYSKRHRAERARLLLYKQQSLLSRIEKRRGRFYVTVSGANSYTSMVMSDPEGRTPRPILSKKHESPYSM